MPFVKPAGTHSPDVVMFRALAVLPQWQCSTFMDPSDKDSAGAYFATPYNIYRRACYKQ